MSYTHNVREIVASAKSAVDADEAARLHALFDRDPRRGVRDALTRMDKCFAAMRDEELRTDALYAEIDAAGEGSVVVGIDEVGRGPLAGPLTVAAVVLPSRPRILGLDDSKKLSPAKREELAGEIRAKAVSIGIASAAPRDIDEKGVSACLRSAMLAALEDVGLDPDLVLIDGNPVHIHPKERCVVKGDGKIACIAAASIVAKVARDAYMVRMDDKYPGYGFARNKGYGSSEHIEAIRAKGLTDIHRATFCAGLIQESLF